MWKQTTLENAIAGSANLSTEDGGMETVERPDSTERDQPTAEQIESSEPEEWDKEPEWTEYPIQERRWTD